MRVEKRFDREVRHTTLWMMMMLLKITLTADIQVDTLTLHKK